MPFNPSLKTKMSLAFTLLGMVILCIIASLTYHYCHTELKKAITTQQTALVNTIAQQLDDRLGLIQEQLQRVAALTAKSLDTPRTLQRQLNEEEDQRVFFDAGMLVIDPTGKILAEYPYRPERIGASIRRDREYFQETIAGGKPFISSPYLDAVQRTGDRLYGPCPECRRQPAGNTGRQAQTLVGQFPGQLGRHPHRKNRLSRHCR